MLCAARFAHSKLLPPKVGANRACKRSMSLQGLLAPCSRLLLGSSQGSIARKGLCKVPVKAGPQLAPRHSTISHMVQQLATHWPESMPANTNT